MITNEKAKEAIIEMLSDAMEEIKHDGYELGLIAYEILYVSAAHRALEMANDGDDTMLIELLTAYNKMKANPGDNIDHLDSVATKLIHNRVQ